MQLGHIHVAVHSHEQYEKEIELHPEANHRAKGIWRCTDQYQENKHGFEEGIEHSQESLKHSSGPSRAVLSVERLSFWWDIKPTAQFYTPWIVDYSLIHNAIHYHKLAEIRQRIR